MNILQRIVTLGKSYLHSLIQDMHDPEESFDTAIRMHEERLEEIRRSTAECIALNWEKRAAHDTLRLRQQECAREMQAAAENGDENRARILLREADQNGRDADILENHCRELDDTIDSVKEAMDGMVRTVAELKQNRQHIIEQSKKSAVQDALRTAHRELSSRALRAAQHSPRWSSAAAGKQDTAVHPLSEKEFQSLELEEADRLIRERLDEVKKRIRGR